MDDRQTTIARDVACEGIGLHSGALARIALKPAAAGHGLAFQRVDLTGKPVIPAHIDHVVRAAWATVLGIGEVEVATVEHLLAALHGLGIDNALVEVDGPEVPIMDGSAAPFVALIEAAGRVSLDAPRRWLQPATRLSVAEEGRRVELSPAGGLAIELTIDFPGTCIGEETGTYIVSPATFAAEIAPARTFARLSDVKALLQGGMAAGGSLENAIVVDGERILNAGALRFPDEFLRHKILDVIGDLALAGAPVRGWFRGVRSGHGLNHALVRRLLAEPQMRQARA